MPGRRSKATAIIEMEGRTHLSKAEIAERLEAEKALAGNSDKVRCPAWLDKVGKREFRAIVAELKPLGLLTNVDVSMLAAYCEAVSAFRRATDEMRAMEKAAALPKDDERHEPLDYERYDRLDLRRRQWWDKIQRGAVEFGLSTSSRLKLRPPKPKQKPKTKFEEKFGHV
jgi:P27 family predicted phage terminase small subunit